MRGSVTFEDNVLLVSLEGYLKNDDVVKVAKLSEQVSSIIKRKNVSQAQVLFDLRNVYTIEPHVREALVAFLSHLPTHVRRFASVTRKKAIRDIEKTIYTLGGIENYETFNTMQKGLNWVRA